MIMTIIIMIIINNNRHTAFSVWVSLLGQFKKMSESFKSNPMLSSDCGHSSTTGGSGAEVVLVALGSVLWFNQRVILTSLLNNLAMVVSRKKNNRQEQKC